MSLKMYRIIKKYRRNFFGDIQFRFFLQQKTIYRWYLPKEYWDTICDFATEEEACEFLSKFLEPTPKDEVICVASSGTC